jgi:hypothetical protein
VSEFAREANGKKAVKKSQNSGFIACQTEQQAR